MLTVGEAIAQAIAEPRMRLRREDRGAYAGVFLNGRNIHAREGMDSAARGRRQDAAVPPLSGRLTRARRNGAGRASGRCPPLSFRGARHAKPGDGARAFC